MIKKEITDEEIREWEWIFGINQLKRGCRNLLDEIEDAEIKKDLTTLKAIYFHGQTRFNNPLCDRIDYFSIDKDFTESPIERLFLNAFDAIRTSNIKTMHKYYLMPQVEIGKYRVDFELVNDNKKIVVECDGHDFHQKTKEQIKKDNQRERDLKKMGYEVVRFSGSEIYEDAEKCVKDLLFIMEN